MSPRAKTSLAIWSLSRHRTQYAPLMDAEIVDMCGDGPAQGAGNTKTLLADGEER